MKEVGWLAAQARNMKHIGSPFVDKGRLQAFFKIHPARRARELLNLNSNRYKQ
jgi:hypothetical protein